MGVNMHMTAYAGKNSKEFKRHYSIVEFCIEKESPLPEPTSNFFQGCFPGDDIGNYGDEDVLDRIKDGIEIEMRVDTSDYQNELRLKVRDIPVGVDEIVVRLS